MGFASTIHETGQKWIAAGITLVLVVVIGGMFSPFFYRRRVTKLKAQIATASAADKPPLEKQLGELKKRTGVRQALALAFGADERLSTSKTMAVAWSAVVAYVLIALLLIVPTDKWDDALTNVWPTYLLLLGGPYAGLVLAQAATSTKVDSGSVQKTKGDGTPRLGDLIGDDDGQPDVTDFQYVVFNLIAIAFVLASFWQDVKGGFPDLPLALALLTGGPLAVYLGRKTLDSSRASVTAVSPAVVSVGDEFTVYGQNLMPPGGKPPTVTVEDTKPTVAADASDTAIKVTIAQTTDALRQRSGDLLDVVVVTDAGATAKLGGALKVLAPPAVAGLDRTTAAAGDTVTLTGVWNKGAGSAAFKIGSVAVKADQPDPGRTATFLVPQLTPAVHPVVFTVDGQESAAGNLQIT